MSPMFAVMTSNQPGAVGIVQVSGDGREVARVLSELCVKPPATWPVGRLRLCGFAGIDEGLAGMISPTTAQLMPHGGPRVMQKLTAWLRDHGVPPEADVDPVNRYPEADSPIEADVLHAIAAAASPAAIDRLAAQPARWRRWYTEKAERQVLIPDKRDALIVPPTVVVVGRPNVGKSTLLNQLLGRSASVVADLPGTTRDWVGGLVELTPPGRDALCEAVAVRWLDTPGIHDSDDDVEQRAIALARNLMLKADVLISMSRLGEEGLPSSEFPRKPDFSLLNNFDESAHRESRGACVINAATGNGLDTLTARVLVSLGLAGGQQDSAEPWAFSPALKRWADGESTSLAAYLGV
ncbi:MAG: GTPase [Planctomycetota bacterium]